MASSTSLPSRGAWIEMISDYTRYDLESVAPLAGSVDRNECKLTYPIDGQHVAPLAGSVDRNNPHYVINLLNAGRSPRGERG